MQKEIKFNEGKLKIIDEGYGIPVVLLHGYLESLDIWHPFSELVKQKYRPIRIDLPGHGNSDTIDKVHTMDLMADAVNRVLDELNINKSIIVGHSMGGYVTLAFAEKYPARIMGFSLFHSSPFPDTEEKKQNRDKEIEYVKQGKKDMIINLNIPMGFANDNLEVFSKDVKRAKHIALKTPEEGIIACLEGMKVRPDRTNVIKNSKVPFLWILGEKDNYIPFNTMKKRAEYNSRGELFSLKNSGHMGFLEESQVSFEKINSFIELCINS